MNLIVIMLDSFRQDHIGVYHRGRAPFSGILPCQTPNIDAFAQQCIIFDNAYPEAFPTIPVRTALMTGQRTLPFRPWQPLTSEDVTVAELLRQEGYVCGLGQLFATLRQLGYYDDSLILLIADHGHPLADHGKFLKGADRMYNELLRVPFLLRLPGGRDGGRRASALVQFHDVLPTLFDLMGLSALTADMHGQSFRRVVEGGAADHRHQIITGYHAGEDRCIRDARWSLILRPEREADELYDLVADPGERANLIDQHPEVATDLARRFGSLYFRSGASVTEVKGIQGAYEVASGSVE